MALRKRGTRLLVEELEGRLPLGDALLGPVFGLSWLGVQLTLAEPDPVAAAPQAHKQPELRGDRFPFGGEFALVLPARARDASPVPQSPRWPPRNRPQRRLRRRRGRSGKSGTPPD